MKFVKLAALLLAMVVGLAGGVSAGEFNLYASSGSLRADSFRIASQTTIGGDSGGLGISGQDRRFVVYASSTDTVTADVWAARSDGLRLTKLGQIIATSSTLTPVSLTVPTIAGYQKIIISPTDIGTGNKVLSGMVYQVK